MDNLKGLFAKVLGSIFMFVIGLLLTSIINVVITIGIMCFVVTTSIIFDLFLPFKEITVILWITGVLVTGVLTMRKLHVMKRMTKEMGQTAPQSHVPGQGQEL